MFAEPSCFSSALILRQRLTIVTQASLEFEICLSLPLYLTAAAIYNTTAIFSDIVLSSCLLPDFSFVLNTVIYSSEPSPLLTYRNTASPSVIFLSINVVSFLFPTPTPLSLSL